MRNKLDLRLNGNLSRGIVQKYRTAELVKMFNPSLTVLDCYVWRKQNSGLLLVSTPEVPKVSKDAN